MENILGFSTAPSKGGDFTPIVKFDARAGRIFRMDRIENNGNFTNEAVDITHSFKAIADFERMEAGWMLFASGIAPVRAMGRAGVVQVAECDRLALLIGARIRARHQITALPR